MKYLLILSMLIAGEHAFAQKLGCNTTALHSVRVTDQVSFFDTVYRGRTSSFDPILWDPGSSLKVKFLSGSPSLRQRVKSIAQQWEKFANIRFIFSDNGNSDIRIFLNAEDGHYSLIGKKALEADEEQYTISIDTADLGNSMNAWQSVVLHQFGHALGLQHEHATPVHGIAWNRPAIYSQYGRIGISEDLVDEVIFPDLNLSHANGTALDKKSIMMFPVLKKQTTNGYEVPWNGSLSEDDKQLISNFYPKGYRRLSQSIATISKDNIGISVVQNSHKEGLSFYPTIDITSIKENSKIYVCVLLYDEDGNPLPDNNGNYAFGSTVAAGKTTNLIANTNLHANKNKAKDYELFIPFSEIPLATGQNKLKVKLVVVQVLDFSEMRTLHQTDAVSYEMKPPGTAGITNPVELTFPSKSKS